MFKVVNKNNLQLFVEKSNKAMKCFNFFALAQGECLLSWAGKLLQGRG